jgi:predicted negative regulator of RcsB-dependent stress response
MLKLAFRYFIPLAFLAMVLLVGYNLYYGDAQEKAQSQAIVDKVQELGSDVLGLLQSEKEKFDAGKYDDAMGKLRSGIASLQQQITNGLGDTDALQRDLDQLQREEESLEMDLNRLSGSRQSGSPSTNQMGSYLRTQTNSRIPEQELDQINNRIRTLVSDLEKTAERARVR